MRAAMLAALLTAGCVGLPEARSVSCAAAPRPPVVVADGTASTEISILTYNVEGLAWPARSGRASALREIGERLSVLREAGKAPDVVLFQEMFRNEAVRAVEATGYPSIAPGPTRDDARPMGVNGGLPGAASPLKGELGLRFLSSGLAVASVYPITARATRPFARGSCAGFDCLANKGVQFARIAIPGVPGTLDVFNTHMNAQDASRVAERRHLEAHRRQAAEVSEFVALHADPASPLVLGGDFNMRHSEPRFAEFQRLQPLEIVHRWCVERPGECDVRASWDGDEPWMDTQDLQLFWSGDRVSIRPVRVEAMFDGAAQPRLSDHDGFLVTYRLSWSVKNALAPACPGLPAAR